MTLFRAGGPGGGRGGGGGGGKKTTADHVWLKVLLPPCEIESRIRVHVALDMQLITQRWRPTEENARLGWSMNFTDRPENGVPVRAAKIGRGPQSCDGIRFRVGVVNHDVRCVIGLDPGG